MNIVFCVIYFYNIPVFIFVHFLYRFHGTVIKSLKSRQAEVIEIHVPLTTSMSQIQTCLLDIMNYTVKQLKSINRTLDMQVSFCFHTD